MLQESESMFLLELADMLRGHQADTKIVAKSLEFICRAFDFQCGMIYEAEFANQFSLMEHYASSPVAFQEYFSTEKLAPQEQELLISKDVLFIEKNSENTSIENKVLLDYNADAIAATSVADEKGLIYGFAVMVCLSSERAFDEEKIKIISAALSMIGRYTGIRMYQKKIIQNRITIENILDNMGIDIYVNDFYNHDVLYANKSMAEPYGGKEKFLGRYSVIPVLA